EGKVRSELLFGHVEALLLQSLAVEADVPRLELACREPLELLELATRDRARLRCELFEECSNLRDRARHLRRERILGIVLEADERGELLTQLQDLLHQAPVVPALGR